jgi:type II secretory pathway component GspD/PulD (secretin)
MLIAKPKSAGLILVLALILIVGAGVAAAETVTFQFIDAEYKDVFRTLGEAAGLNVLVDASVAGRGSFNFSDVDLIEALDLVAHFSGADYRITNNTLLVAAREKLAQFEKSQIHLIHTRYVNPEQLVPILSMVIPAENIYVKSDSNLIIINGSSEMLREVESIVSKLDVPSERSYKEEDSVLGILQLLTEELGLNLIADPSLSSIGMVFNLQNLDPMTALKLAAQEADLDLTINQDTVIVSRKGVQEPEPAAAREKIKVYRLNYTDPSVVSRMLQLIVPAERIQIDDGTKSLIIKATETEIAAVDEFILEYDQPLPQVLLEVWIHEIADDAAEVLGIDWSGTLPSLRANSDNPDTLFHAELNWQPWEILFALHALEEQGKARILASPKIAAISGQEATFFVGDRIPIVLTDDEGRQQMEFLESGITLTVLPRISNDDFITIDVRPEVSLFVHSDTTEYPQIRTREAETSVRVKDGQPVLIGGLIQEQEGETINKVPFLGNLPVLGKLFQKSSTTKEKTEMNIILIPRIVDGSEGLVTGSFFPAAQ